MPLPKKTHEFIDEHAQILAREGRSITFKEMISIMNSEGIPCPQASRQMAGSIKKSRRLAKKRHDGFAADCIQYGYTDRNGNYPWKKKSH